MANLLILGGGICQLNAFRKAKEKGHAATLFDYLADPPAASLAAAHRRVSAFDPDACLKEARSLALDGVMTVGTDQPVYTCARIAEDLGLPRFLRPETAFAVTNKAAMKRILSGHGIPTAPWFLADKETLPRLPFKGPVVLKPVDSQGQRGVIRAANVVEAAAFFDWSIAFSRCEKILCEAYCPSQEVTVNAWVRNGVAHVLAVTDRVCFDHDRHIGVCAAHRFPSLAAEGKEHAVKDISQKVASAFGIGNGPLYIQLLLTEDGIVVNELSARVGGAFEDVFIPWLTGVDILGAVMDAALGLAPVIPGHWPGPPSRHVRVLMPFARPGTIAAMESPETIRARDYVLDARFTRKPGDAVPPFENAGSRLGVIVVGAESGARMQACLDHLYSSFHVRDAKGNDMLLDGWRVR